MMRPPDLTTVSRIRSRQIGESDLATVVGLLARGFPSRPARFWMEVFTRLAERCSPGGLPRYGYLLETDSKVVGAILLIFSIAPGSSNVRCNVSSWFVEEGFRSYASLLVSKALSHPGVTYLNITPAPPTLSAIRAQGYSQYSRGVFVALAVQFSTEAGHVVDAAGPRSIDLEPFEQGVLDDHARYGCMSLRCETANGIYPFVFRPRVHKWIPCAQLVYCRSLDHLVRCAGPIGRFLLMRGRPFVIIDSDGPIRGLIGKYFDGRMPRYFKGPDRPRLGDLAYTETAMFGM